VKNEANLSGPAFGKVIHNLSGRLYEKPWHASLFELDSPVSDE